MINKILILVYKFFFKSETEKKINDLYKNIFYKNEIIIFDVGANKGQSINRFINCFKDPYIYAFEPNKNIISELKIFENKKRIAIFNIAFGNLIKKINFYEMIKSGNSSILNFNNKSKDYRIRQKAQNKNDLVKLSYEVDQTTIDDFVKQKKIEKINILKIDVQGYAPEVLEGSINMIKENLIDVIEVELILSDLYEKSNNIYDIEKFLIPNNYKLIGQVKNISNIKINSPFSIDLVYGNKYIYEMLNK